MWVFTNTIKNNAGPDRWWDRELGRDCRVGPIGNVEAAALIRGSVGGAGPCDRQGPVGPGERHRESTVHRRDHERDHAAAPRGPHAGPTLGSRGRPDRRLRCPRGDPGVGQRVDDRQGRHGVGRPGRFPAGEVPRERDRRQGTRLRAATIRVWEEDVPGI